MLPLPQDGRAEASTLNRLHSLPATALFTPEEAGLYLNARTDLLRAWRCQGRGPAFLGCGHFVRYPKRNLDDFLARTVGQCQEAPPKSRTTPELEVPRRR